MPSYCCSSSDFLQSHYTVLLSSFLLPFSRISWCCCSLPCIPHILQVQIVGFFFSLSSLLLWYRSRISAVTQGFLFSQCLPRISLAVSVTAVLKIVITESKSFFLIIHDGERCKLPAHHSLEGFHHIRIFQLFEVRLESCVFWLADSSQAKVEGHHQQVVVTSNVCSWKTSCSGDVHS